MTKTAYRTSIITLAFTLAISAGALAAGLLKGKTYQGKTPSSGVDSEGHRQRLTVTGISLGVAASGKSVTVRFASNDPILYCVTQELLHSQSTKPALISKSGTFKATIDQRFAAGSLAPAVVQVVSGQFSGHTVKGTIHTQAGECSGVTTFSATAG
jgi:hypothetical protein